MPLGSDPLPRLERVFHSMEGGAELRAVPEQHVGHRRLVDPVHAGVRIELARVVAREEAVALQATRRHEDEDAEGGVAETEPPRFWLGVEADHRVDGLDVTVYALELAGPRRVVGHLPERSCRRQTEEPSELVVARYSALTHPHDVG